MDRIALVCEKPSLCREVVASLLRLHPDLRLDRLAGVIGNPVENLDWAFDIPTTPDFRYPRRIAWRDYPIILEPTYKSLRIGMDTNNRCFDGIDLHDRDGGPHQGLRFRMRDFDVRAAFSKADLVIVAMDASSPSVHAAERLLDVLFPEGLEGRNLTYPWITDLTTHRLDASIRDAEPWHVVRDRHLAHSLVKRRFTFNYAVNGLGLLGRTLREVGLPGTVDTMRVGPVVSSRNTLQLLYHLRDVAGPVHEGRLYDHMETWPGTGRYRDSVGASMGSCSSRASIVDGAAKIGLLERSWDHDGPSFVRLSDLGRRYLDAIHPDCRDPDQPFRLEQWRNLPTLEAAAKVDRYLRTFFGKQKRFMARVR